MTSEASVTNPPDPEQWMLPGCVKPHCKAVFMQTKQPHTAWSEPRWKAHHDPVTHERWGALMKEPNRESLPHEIAIGNVRILPREWKFFLKDAPLKLTPTQARILIYLAKHLGEVCTYTDIVTNAFGKHYLPTHPTDKYERASMRHLVRVNVSRLRHILEDSRDVIETISDVGFRLRQEESPAQ